jgi:alpha-L-fucosidase
MAGFSKDKRAMGDYDTPEQEIPAAAVTGKDWETCMTMNDNWGYNAKDKNFKSSEDLVRKLIDIASKNGNFLLNIGPTADGTFPQESIDRLRDVGAWMQVHGESIYGTKASPFKSLPWGRCTQKPLDGGATRLYLHVFEWPKDGKLVIGGLLNEPKSAAILTAADKRPLSVARDGDALVVSVPPTPASPYATVVMLDVQGKADVGQPPTISAAFPVFIDSLDVTLATEQENVEVRYTIDGSEPTAASPRAAGAVKLSNTATVKARGFRGVKPVSPSSAATFTKVTPQPASKAPPSTSPGLKFEYFEGEWSKLPDFDSVAVTKKGVVPDFEFSPRNHEERFGFRYRAYLNVPVSGVYRFHTVSDDGSQLLIADELVVDNDGLHGMSEKSGVIALSAGQHPLTVTFFERTGGDGLEVWWSGPGIEKQRLPKAAFSH